MTKEQLAMLMELLLMWERRVDFGFNYTHGDYSRRNLEAFREDVAAAFIKEQRT